MSVLRITSRLLPRSSFFKFVQVSIAGNLPKRLFFMFNLTSEVKHLMSSVISQISLFANFKYFSEVIPKVPNAGGKDVSLLSRRLRNSSCESCSTNSPGKEPISLFDNTSAFKLVSFPMNVVSYCWQKSFTDAAWQLFYAVVAKIK